MNLFDLTGKKGLVIGGEGNLGPIWMETLRDAGAHAYSIGLPYFDFTNDEDLRRAPEIVLQAVGTPDIIVCNAAIDTPPTKTEARFFTDFERTMQVNVNAHARLLEKFIPDMIQKGGGVVVLIGSIQGYIGADWRNYEPPFEKPCSYNCSKAALQQLARSITVQYGRFGIRAVCPGFGPYVSKKLPPEFLEKITSKIPMGRTVSKESLQRTLLYAVCCEDLAGEDWLCDGGYTKI
jgi:NAD(P)-dependent dehydrogenase (short-subunit alcohol dehydrogenase family)